MSGYPNYETSCTNSLAEASKGCSSVPPSFKCIGLVEAERLFVSDPVSRPLISVTISIADLFAALAFAFDSYPLNLLFSVLSFRL